MNILNPIQNLAEPSANKLPPLTTNIYDGPRVQHIGHYTTRALENRSSVVAFTTTTFINQISALGTVNIYAVLICIFFANLDLNYNSGSSGC